MKVTIKGVVFSLSIIAAFAGIEAWILRLPCKSEANFTKKSDGYVLVNSVVGRYTSGSFGDCVEKCTNQYQCASLNYKDTGSDNCELNEKIKENSPSSDFKLRASWAYHSTDYNTLKIGGLCVALDPCTQTNHICIDSCQCPGYQCIPCGINRVQASREICKFRFKHALRDIAQGKVAEQSSYWSQAGNAGKAVDGNFDPIETSATKHENNPWWRVDLAREASVQAVSIQNRKSQQWWSKINPFHIRVGNSLVNNGRSNPLCFENARFTSDAQLKRFPCQSELIGRYVVIHCNKRVVLAMAEVQVFGFYYSY